MDRSARLLKLAESMRHEQDEASRRVADLREALERSERQLADLQGYLHGYRKGHAGVGESASAAQLHNYNAFLDELQRAICQQQRSVDEARRAFEMQFERWKQVRTRVRAVEQAADRHAARESGRLERKEQRQSDDMALRRYLEQLA
jgi:flagellar FliJ protein